MKHSQLDFFHLDCRDMTGQFPHIKMPWQSIYFGTYIYKYVIELPKYLHNRIHIHFYTYIRYYNKNLENGTVLHTSLP